MSMRDHAESDSRASLAARTLELVGTWHAKPLALRLMVAVVAVLVAVAVRAVLLDALGGRLVYLTFFPAVAIAALLGGIGLDESCRAVPRPHTGQRRKVIEGGATLVAEQGALDILVLALNTSSH